MKHLFLSIAACWCLALPARAAGPGVGAAEIVIGQSISLQGGRNDYGVAARQGMQLYVDATNRQGGVWGRQLTLKTLDDNGQPAQAEAHARALVQQGVFLLFGSVEGGPSTAVAQVATENGVPFFGPMAGSPGLRKPHQPGCFRSGPNIARSSAPCWTGATAPG